MKFERIEKSLNEYLNLFQMGPFVTVKDKNKEMIIDKAAKTKKYFLKRLNGIQSEILQMIMITLYVF